MATPLQNTLATWHALFLRETLERLFSVRMGWAWLIIEPTLHIVAISVFWTIISKRQMGGIDTAVWVILGMLAFFLFRRTGVQAMHSIDCNRAFFAFRQVRPFDTVFIRACVEAYIMIFISIFILLGAAFLGREIFPHDILLIFGGTFGLWSLGLGYGMVSSVIMRLVPETTHLLGLFMMPLYFISGVILPISTLPYKFREYIMLNPIIHGIEAIRLGFAPYYNTIPIDLGYLYMWSLCSIVLGLVLYRIYETRLIAL